MYSSSIPISDIKIKNSGIGHQIYFKLKIFMPFCRKESLPAPSRPPQVTGAADNNTATCVTAIFHGTVRKANENSLEFVYKFDIILHE